MMNRKEGLVTDRPKTKKTVVGNEVKGVKRPVRRYRPGQQPKGYEERSSDSDASEEETDAQEDDRGGDPGVNETDVGLTWAKKAVGQSYNEPEEGSQDDAESDTHSRETSPAGAMPVFGTSRAQETILPFDEVAVDAKDEDSESSETESETSSSSSSTADVPIPPPILYKPVFVAKGARSSRAGGVTGKADLAEDELVAQKTSEQERRRIEAQALAQQTIERELLLKKAAESGPDIELDDTDGLDPEGEYQEWKLRELTRLKRDEEERNAMALEKAAVEARRAMPEGVRLKEDMEYARQSRLAKAAALGLGQSRHKGAFYQEEVKSVARPESTLSESQMFRKNRLPQSFQTGEFAKSKRTKYLPLKEQDTTR